MAASQMLEEYLAYLQVEKGLASNSVQAYASDLRQFRTFLKNQGLEWIDVETQHVILYVETLEQHDLAPRTRARKLAALRSY